MLHLGTVMGGSLLMAVAAHVTVPFWPVPLTLQSLVAFGLGAVLGPFPAMLAILAWIVEGLVGIPVFAAGAGPATLFGPTGGYILGFLPAAAIAGIAARVGWTDGRPWRAAAAFVAADAALFAVGVAWLAVLFGWEKAVAVGLSPFLLGEALKLGLATACISLRAGRRTREA